MSLMTSTFKIVLLYILCTLSGCFSFSSVAEQADRYANLVNTYKYERLFEAPKLSMADKLKTACYRLNNKQSCRRLSMLIRTYTPDHSAKALRILQQACLMKDGSACTMESFYKLKFKLNDKVLHLCTKFL